MRGAGFEPGVDAPTRRALLDVQRQLNVKPDMQFGGVAPASPRRGDLWFDSPSLKLWDGASWVTV